MNWAWEYAHHPPQVVVSGADGSYTASAASVDLVHVELPEGAGFHAPCASGLDGLEGRITMDIHVVSDDTLSSTGLPASVPTTDLKVRGNVMTRTAAGVQVITGAIVRLTLEIDHVPRSSTLSDRSGRFLLCSNVPRVHRGDTLWLHVQRKDIVLRLVRFRLARRTMSLSSSFESRRVDA
jgi:hypothetical protein